MSDRWLEQARAIFRQHETDALELAGIGLPKFAHVLAAALRSAYERGLEDSAGMFDRRAEEMSAPGMDVVKWYAEDSARRIRSLKTRKGG